MPKLIKISSSSEPQQRHVIFIHGLGGHPYETWQADKTDKHSFWPAWLANELENTTIWTLSYPAAPSNWLGTAIPLPQRAVSVLAMLANEPALQQGDIAFINHSLGGLVVKQLLRQANDQCLYDPSVERLLKKIKAVVFYGTPHTGSQLATWTDRLRVLVRPSAATQDLLPNDPNLLGLNTWYRNWSTSIKHRVYYETQSTSVGIVVDPGSADAGLIHVTPIPLDGDHFGICKPVDDSDQRYVLTREFLKNDAFQEIVKPDASSVGKGVALALPLPEWPETPPSLDWPIANHSDVYSAFETLLTRSNTQRLLTVSGPSESGKSLIAQQMFGNALRIPDLACGLFNFKGTTDMDNELRTFIQHLDASFPSTGRNLNEKFNNILEALKNNPRPTLLIFDTYETVGEAQNWVEGQLLSFLIRAPWLRVAITGQQVPKYNGIASWQLNSIPSNYSRKNHST